MKRNVEKTEAAAPFPKRKRVAAYARVSLGTEHMLHSLAAQVSHYSKYIQSRPDWEYAGVYADSDETGTRSDRPEFQRLLSDCRAGLVDIVITKAISRFARNTVTLLETVRELKERGIDIFFEEQDIHTLSNDGELMLTILAGYAQEESRSVSENIKWRKRNDMARGKTVPLKVFGYEVVDRNLVIKPDEAETVKMIFDLYLGGLGQRSIAVKLNELGITTKDGYKWSSGTVRNILTNPKMCGNLLHQRAFVTDHISKKSQKNRGELPMYFIESTHEGIISKEVFNAVQTEMKRRGGIGTLNESEGVVFRKLIVCAACGYRFHHTSSGRGASKCRSWVCGGRDKRTGAGCKTLQIPEPTLMKAAAEALGLTEFDGEVFSEKTERIVAGDNRCLTFIFKDGTEKEIYWQKRKSVPYSVIGKEKREGKNICYSIIGRGNGKVGERRRKKMEEEEVIRNAESGSDTGKKA